MEHKMADRIALLNCLNEDEGLTQRELAERLGMSLGKVNQLLGICVEAGELYRELGDGRGRGRSCRYRLAPGAWETLQPYRVEAAVILASGFGSRFVPLSYEQPKGLLEVFGERMLERQLRQLQERGITDITIMVGYLKEKFEYLIDSFGVRLIYNPEFADKNTLATLYHAREAWAHKNCYILASDNWIRHNMFHSYEPYAWYAASFMSGPSREWALRHSSRGVVSEIEVGAEDAWCMYGPAYFSREFAEAFLPFLESFYHMPGTEQYYWEEVLRRCLRQLPPLHVNQCPEDEVYEFENLEELRRFDEKYVRNSGSQAMQLVAEVLEIPESDVQEIRCLKAGMTNKSWLFKVNPASDARPDLRGKAFICRIPGPGTEKLIDRRQEWQVYRTVGTLGITEQLAYFDPDSGYKLSVYYEQARPADFACRTDRLACMQLLKRLHNSGLSLPHHFNLRERLSYYESLCREVGEIPFYDYEQVRQQAEFLLDFTEKYGTVQTIAHVDSVKDNFLLTKEGWRMIDWEYCGMADPLLDLAMCAIYSYMNYDEAEMLLCTYLQTPLAVTSGACTQAPEAELAAASAKAPEAELAAALAKAPETELTAASVKAFEAERSGQSGAHEQLFGVAARGRDLELMKQLLVAYMGLGGLLWAVWAVYKSLQGENFGDYTLKMYRYVKNSYKILQKSQKN